MEEDRTLFGQGRYPDTGPLAVLARLAFLGSVLAIVVAVILPPWLTPHFARSQYTEHLAAFYVLGLAALAAMPRRRLLTLGLGLMILATVLEASHLVAGAALTPAVDNWVADVGGLAAAFIPVTVERFRRRFPPLLS